MDTNKFEQIKKLAINEHIPIIMDDTLEAISSYMQNQKPKYILEIGTAVGYSAICFSKYLENEGRIDTIEMDTLRAEKAKENVKQMELEDKINIIVGNAIEILPSINQKYDMIFIDAAKGKYPAFLKEAIRLSKKGTIIFADNVLYKGYVLGDYNKHKQRTAVNHLREYLKDVQEDVRLKTEILDIGDGLAVSIVK